VALEHLEKKRLLGHQSLLRLSYRPWRAYWRADFHPSQQSSDLSETWLQQNTHVYTRVDTA
jgi:uncharacterized protein